MNSDQTTSVPGLENRPQVPRARWRPLLTAVIGVLLAFGIGFQVGRGEAQPSSFGSILSGNLINRAGGETRVKDLDFNLFWDVWNILQKEYVDRDDLSDTQLFYGALRGLVSATDDPYSAFLDPGEAREFEENLSGIFEGIGAEIGMRDNTLVIIAPLDDMPAIKAGIRAGDKIFAIDGEDTAGLTIDAAVKKIRGPKGTTVTLTIVRDENGPLDIAVVRDTVTVQSVRTTHQAEDNISIIKVYNFNGETRSAFSQAVQEVLAAEPAGLILDVRNNPGGYLETAVAMASQWIEDGPVVIEEFGDGRRLNHDSLGTARLADLPTTVLINQGSASASEIVAGALRDRGKAVLIGKKTFGKGSVQVLRELADGSILKITTAKWLTPNGSYIHNEGIEPDIEIDRTIEDRENERDPQLDRALEELRGLIIR